MLLAHPLLAQDSSYVLSGVVSDAAGRVIAGAEVTIWHQEQPIGTVWSREDGSFGLRAQRGVPATAVFVRAIGFFPQSVLVPGLNAALRIVLLPYLQPLPEIIVAAARRHCPNTNAPEAHALWQAVAAKYEATPLDRSQHSSFEGWFGDVQANQVGGEAGKRGGLGWTNRDGGYRVAAERRIKATGYALALDRDRPNKGTFLDLLDPAFFAWWYPRLDLHDSEHFLRDSFGTLSLSVAESDAGEWRIAFCSVGRKTPGIQGTITIASDSSLRDAQWRFVTPSPNEDAGGTVTFLAPSGAIPWRHLPGTSVYLRRLGGSRTQYYQEYRVHRSWDFGPTGRLPSRHFSFHVKGGTGSRPTSRWTH